jgi:hypothetical protein
MINVSEAVLQGNKLLLAHIHMARRGLRYRVTRALQARLRLVAPKIRCITRMRDGARKESPAEQHSSAVKWSAGDDVCTLFL